MHKAILALLETFAEIERELGQAVFEDAVDRARLAVAAEVMVEAERRAIRDRRSQCETLGECVILPFPSRIGRSYADEV